MSGLASDSADCEVVAVAVARSDSADCEAVGVAVTRSGPRFYPESLGCKILRTMASKTSRISPAINTKTSSSNGFLKTRNKIIKLI
jgi:hypothetical protein